MTNLAFGFSIIFFFTIESICCMQAPICQVFALIKYKLFNFNNKNIGEKKIANESDYRSFNTFKISYKNLINLRLFKWKINVNNLV